MAALERVAVERRPRRREVSPPNPLLSEHNIPPKAYRELQNVRLGDDDHCEVGGKPRRPLPGLLGEGNKRRPRVMNLATALAKV